MLPSLDRMVARRALQETYRQARRQTLKSIPSAWSSSSSSNVPLSRASRLRLSSTTASSALPQQCRSALHTSASPYNANQEGSGRRSKGEDANKASSLDAGQSPPTKTLAEVLAKSIKELGPVTVSTFMNVCLQDPGQGYYASANSPSQGSEAGALRDVLGARGDFITSPEISQVFGELLAVFYVARWQSVNPDAPSRIVELGPGRGTLLADVLRTFSRFKAFFHQLKEIHLVETSPGLISLQHDAISEVLQKAGKKLVAADKEVLESDEIRIEWFPQASMVPVQPQTWTMAIAHEFFDALPSYIFERTSDGFREVLVDIERPSEGQKGVSTIKASDLVNKSQVGDAPAMQPPKFRHVLSAQPTPWSMLLADRNPRFSMLQPGQRVEISSEGWGVARRMGELVAGRTARPPQAEEEKLSEEQRKHNEEVRLSTASKGGVGIIIDYGDEKAFGGSFRAFKAHRQVEPLDAPGTADLTCNVDFAHLRTAVQSTDARAVGPMFQAHFLQALGLEQRLSALVANANSDERRREIEGSGRRLVDASGMGAQYKAFGIVAEANEGSSSSSNVNKELAKETVKCYPFEM